ncbi:gliding motility-associated C-terminal domain-containing protein [Telluribacter humicola]|uniref:gliding motility-associated C-terminal domain-containing protein n=1 Tax=Telluribacter humicola TaxID=1720261 RepID=UPI001A9653DA|nr:gliding motility-associated C-terminal domain-containing protein [Telluribacter humicola]
MSFCVAQCPTSIPDLYSYGTGTTAVIDIEECLPRTIKARPTLDGATNIRTIFNYLGGPLHPDSLKTDSIHTYTKPGTYTLVQLSEKEGVKLIGCSRVVVNDTLPPKVKLITCQDGTIKVTFDAKQPSSYHTYWVDWGDGTISEVPVHLRATNHGYLDNTTPHTIAVWGVQRLGTCKGSTAFIEYKPEPPSAKPQIRELTSTPSNQVELVTENPLALELLVMKQAQDGTFEPTGLRTQEATGRVTVPQYSSQSACFRLETSDACLAGLYQSEVACTATLTLTDQPEGNGLAWHTEQAGPTMKIELWKDGKSWKDISALGTSNQLNDAELSCNTEHCYQLRITTASTVSTSPIHCRKTPLTFCSTSSPLYIPEAFSPNNDGINDYFEIKGELPADFRLSIFNQWGSVLYHTTNPAMVWDGSSKGTPLPPGHYTYLIRYKDARGKDYQKTGTILLLK